MKYYTIERSGVGYEKYAVKSKDSFLLVRFEDKDKPDIFDISRKYFGQNPDFGNLYYCVGSDNRTYSFNLDTEEIKVEKKTLLLKF